MVGWVVMEEVVVVEGRVGREGEQVVLVAKVVRVVEVRVGRVAMAREGKGGRVAGEGVMMHCSW
jgi:hypothetical protein